MRGQPTKSVAPLVAEIVTAVNLTQLLAAFMMLAAPSAAESFVGSLLYSAMDRVRQNIGIPAVANIPNPLKGELLQLMNAYFDAHGRRRVNLPKLVHNPLDPIT
jgi:hypothetical protein